VKGDGVNHAQITHQLQMPHIVLVVDSVRHHHLCVCACMGISTRGGIFFWGGGRLQISHVVFIVDAARHHHLCVCVCMRILTRGGHFGGAGSTPNVACCPHVGSMWRHHLCCVRVHRGGVGGQGLSSRTLPRGRWIEEDRLQKVGEDKLHGGEGQELSHKKETLHVTKHKHRKLQ